MSNTTDLANAFMEMSKAVAKVPELEAKVSDLTNEKQSLEQTLDHVNGTNKHLEDEIEFAKKHVAELEAALADATFREDYAKTMLDDIRKAMGLPTEAELKAKAEAEAAQAAKAKAEAEAAIKAANPMVTIAEVDGSSQDGNQAQGQSEDHPTAAPLIESGPWGAPTPNAGQGESASGMLGNTAPVYDKYVYEPKHVEPLTPPTQIYANWRWYDRPDGVSITEFQAAGGEREHF